MSPRTPSSIVKGTGEFDVELALGRLLTDGRNPLIKIGKFGYNPAVGTSLEVIWSLGGLVTWLTAPEFMRIKSGGDAADDFDQDGAREIFVQGIGEDLKLRTEMLITAGTAASVQTTKKFWRVWRVRVTKVGLYGGVNTGAIVVESVDTATVMIEAEAEKGTSRVAIFSTPDDHTALIRHVLLSVEGTKLVNFSMHRRADFTNVTAPCAPFNIVRQMDAVIELNSIDLLSFPVLPPLTDFFIAGSVTAGSSKASAAFDILLMPTT